MLHNCRRTCDFNPFITFQVFGGDSDDDDEQDSQVTSKEGATKKAGKTWDEDEDEEVEDEFDFIVDDHGQPIRRRKEDGTYTEP